ncbi:ABC-type transport auxiliary lipoprotein family protein [Halomonas saccharevitans]|uniref:ABC-type transport auxiliary lipoprotein family protein n=1 Tax=Halomonas saccharevitans TaxID=416872 RepID=A0ABU3N9Z5_9GAMM|nr:ABC-type transport auxiliary lipoprotein family protein [Halomonas saccharevitans]MDT8878014.1 ABC-type transport auxiliary lipoprotein family protein [Halomonas saccharevitans]
MSAIKALAAVLAALWLAGCATDAPPSNRYTLPDDAMAAPTGVAGAEAAHRLRVAPPTLARFLAVDGLVLKLDDITLNEASGHLWAEPLGLQLERRLKARLAARLTETRLLGEAAGEPREQAATLRLTVDRFHGRFDGQAVVAGQWQLNDAEGELLALSPFAVEVPLARDGYPALVRALGRGWNRVVDEIAGEIKRLR